MGVADYFGIFGVLVAGILLGGAVYNGLYGKDMHPFYKEDRTVACYWGCKFATSPVFNVTTVQNGTIYNKCALACQNTFVSQIKRNVSGIS